MRVSYDVNTINALAGADARASASLVWLSAESLVDAADVGIADVEALVAWPPALLKLRAHLTQVVAEAVVSAADSGTLSVEMYYQAAAYISAETGLPIAVVLASEGLEAGAKATVDLVKAGARAIDDLYFGDIRSTEIPKDQLARGPVDIIEVGAEFGGSYDIVTGKIEITYRIEQYEGGYRVVMVTRIFGGVGSTDANIGAVTETEVSWDVADLDSARRLIARLALISPSIVATAITSAGPNPAAIATGLGTLLAGAILRIPMPSEAKVSRGAGATVDLGTGSLSITAVVGGTADFSGSGVPSLTPFGKVEVEGQFDIGPMAGVSGKASIEVDPSGVTIELEGTFKAGPHISGSGGHLKAGKIYEIQGTLKIPADAFDPRLLDRVRFGDPAAIKELMARLHDGSSGHINIYEGVDADAEVDVKAVTVAGHVTHKHLVDTVGFGHEG